MNTIFRFLLVGILFSACTTEPTADEILANAIKAHGGDKIYNSNISFNFRNKHYYGNYTNGSYELSRHFSDSLGNKYIDVLTNNSFKRTINDSLVNVTEKWAGKYSNSINSVFYFFRLPFNLKDEAVIISYLGQGTIDETNYFKLKVTFAEEGGGEDFDDVFVYWFNAKTYTLDYLAYEYTTDGGGKRFRKAFNQRDENGWLINDYINYKPYDTKVNIADYDTYYGENGFKKLSEIVNESIEVGYN